MRGEELYTLIRVAYDHVGKFGRDSARIYRAVVELDAHVRMWRKRAEDLGWVDDTTTSK